MAEDRTLSPIQLAMVADDFGKSSAITSGIAECMELGVVTSTSAMTCCPGAEELIRPYAKSFEGRIGLHLQLTEGRPCLPPEQVSSLVDTEGKFPAHRSEVKSPEPDQALAEWEMQWQRLESWGVRPAHLDSHQHVHFQPALLLGAIRFARDKGVPLRMPNHEVAAKVKKFGIACADDIMLDWYGENLDLEGFQARLEVLRSRMVPDRQWRVEWMCHPAHSDPDPGPGRMLAEWRENEFQILTHPRCAELLRRYNMKLVPAGHFAIQQ